MAECEPCKRWDHTACEGNCSCCVTRTGRADAVIAEMRDVACSPTGRLSLSPAFGMKGTYWGVQVYDGRKKVGPFLVASEDEDQTPGGALRSLARLLDTTKESS